MGVGAAGARTGTLTGVGATGVGTGALIGTRGPSAFNAAVAFTRPVPVMKSNPVLNPVVYGLSISIAVEAKVEYIADTFMDRFPPLYCSIKAATAATCGAAADVP